MARPTKLRRLECLPGSKLFAPAGVPARRLERLRVSFDELEALRLVHIEGVTQAEAGRRLGVSGSTVSRMVERAHRLITQALISDKAICVEGGPVTIVRANGHPEQGEKNMIVAVPYLQGNVNAHFGSTQAFLLAETGDGRVEKTTVFEMQGMQHNHSGIAGFLKEQGVQVVLAGGMGAPMQQALKRQGFELYCGVSGPAVAAVEAFLRGEIDQSESTCDHHHGAH